MSETIDWARTLLALGAASLDPAVLRESLGVIVKHSEDAAKASAALDLDQAPAQ